MVSKTLATAPSVTLPVRPAKMAIEDDIHATITRPLLFEDRALVPAAMKNAQVHQPLATGEVLKVLLIADSMPNSMIVKMLISAPTPRISIRR